MKWLSVAYFITFLSLINGTEIITAQSIQPNPPHLEYVTVDTATNDVRLFWTKSNSSNLTRYNIYRMEQGANPIEEGKSLGFVTPTVFEFTDSISGLAGNKSVHYSVSAFNGTDNSNFSTTHGTIYATVKYDSCKSILKVNWNKYLG
jgi:hypothetical protein